MRMHAETAAAATLCANRMSIGLSTLHRGGSLAAQCAISLVVHAIMRRYSIITLSTSAPLDVDLGALCTAVLALAVHRAGPCGLPTFETADPSILAPLGATIADPSILDPLAWHNSGQGGPSGDVGCVNGRRAFEAFLVLTHLSTDELLDPRDAVRA
eukprot:20351-Heterococcus_DN1.PRE.1